MTYMTTTRTTSTRQDRIARGVRVQVLRIANERNCSIIAATEILADRHGVSSGEVQALVAHANRTAEVHEGTLRAAGIA